MGKNCNVCESVLDLDALFCNGCGQLQQQVQTRVKTKTCPQCEKISDENARFCAKCSFDFTPPVSPPNVFPETVQSAASAVHSPNFATPIKRRYRDGYRVANTVTIFGALLKAFSLIAGIIIGLLGFGLGGGIENAARQNSFGIANASGPALAIVVIFGIFGFLVAVVGWILGVIVSANGQMLKANLDGAVNTSPFLADLDRAEIMSLDGTPSVNNYKSENAVSYQPDSSVQPNLKATLAYGLSFIFGILWIVVPIYLLATTPKENRFVRFHSFQSLLLIVVPFFATILNYVTTFNYISYSPVMILTSYAIYLIVIIVNFLCMWKAYNNEEFKIPVIGDLALNFAQNTMNNRVA